MLVCSAVPPPLLAPLHLLRHCVRLQVHRETGGPLRALDQRLRRAGRRQPLLGDSHAGRCEQSGSLFRRGLGAQRGLPLSMAATQSCIVTNRRAAADVCASNALPCHARGSMLRAPPQGAEPRLAWIV
jgi:hypothetical protein